MSDEQNTDEREADMLGELIRRAGPPEPVPPLVARRVRRNVEQAWRDAQRRRRRPYLAAAAAMVAAVAVAVALLPGRVGAPPAVAGTVARTVGAPVVDGGAALAEGAALRVGDHIVTGAGDAVAVSIDGGASLRVDAGTSVTIVAPRQLRLSRGAVYIDSGPSAPVGPAFEVETPFGRMVDVGTQFQVRVARNHASVLVREGRVDVDASAAATTVVAGAAARIDVAGAIAERELASGDAAWDWAEALASPFVIEGASLYEFLEWAARETGRELRFASDEARLRAQRIRLSGDIDDWRPDDAIAPVVATAGLTGDVIVNAEVIVVR